MPFRYIPKCETCSSPWHAWCALYMCHLCVSLNVVAVYLVNVHVCTRCPLFCVQAQQTYLDNFLSPAIAPLPIKDDILANAWDSISAAAPAAGSNVSFRLATKSPGLHTHTSLCARIQHVPLAICHLHVFDCPGSPMLFSSPDMMNTSLMCTEVIDIDVLENNCCAACGEYAKDIFSYLRESEVKIGYISSCNKR